MRVEKLGEGEPEHAIVACVHGDETCGWHAFNRFKKQDYDLKKPLKFVLANEEAFKLGKRCCDTDLNRGFPGDPESDKYEDKIAHKLKKELEGMKVLDIHSSESKECPFAISVGQEKENIELAKSTGLKEVVDISYVECMIKYFNGIAVECGYKDDEDATDMATKIMKNFLAAEGVIDEEFETQDIELFEVYDEAEGAGFEFTAKNFEIVRENQVYARKQGEERRASKDFYPVLMSTDGYEDMIGFKAQKAEPDIS